MLKKLCDKKNRMTLAALQGILVFFWMVILTETSSLYSSYIFCGLLGFASIFYCSKKEEVTEKRSKIVTWIASGVFACAVLIANYEIFIPVRENLISMALVLAGGYAVAYNTLKLALKAIPFKIVEVREDKEKGKWAVFFICFSAMVIINTVLLFCVLYPGVITNDSANQIRQILNGYTSNHHPFWHTVVISVFLKAGLAVFGNMNAAIATYSMALIIFMAVCFSYAIMTAYCAGISKKAALGMGAFYALVPYNIVYSVTMWKDVVFGGAILLFLVTLFRIIKDIGKKVPNYIGLFLSGIASCLWRTNGWLAVAGFSVVFALAFVFFRKKEKKKKYVKSTVILCAVILISWFMRSPVISMLNISQPDFVESLSIPVQQVARVIKEGKELTEEQSELLSEIMDVEEVPDLYVSWISDPIKDEIRSKNHQYLVDNKGEFLKLWLQLGIKYPADYFKAWIDQTKGYYNGGYSYWTYTYQLIENEFGASRVVNSPFIEKVYNSYFNFLDEDIFSPLFSIGLHVWALSALAIAGLVKKREESVLFVLILLIIGTLLIATPVYSEFRYAYAMFTALPFLAAVTLNQTKRKEE